MQISSSLYIVVFLLCGRSTGLASQSVRPSVCASVYQHVCPIHVPNWKKGSTEETKHQLTFPTVGVS